MSCTDSFYRAIYCVLFDSIQESVFSLISLNIQKLKKKNSGIFISFTPVEIHCYGTNAFWRNHVALSFGVPRVSSVGLSISGIRLLVGYFNHLNSFSWKCLWCLVGAMPEKGLDLIFSHRSGVQFSNWTLGPLARMCYNIQHHCKNREITLKAATADA